jgi:uncharacterized membrane protein
MADFDKFDNPSYSSQNVEFEDEGIAGQAMGAIEPVKKFLPMIIAIIVIAAIAWFAYDYFVGSMLSVTLSVKDTEGKLLGESNVKVYAEGQSTPVFSDSGLSAYDLKLKPGDYRLEATAPGYAVKKTTFSVSASDTEPMAVLAKDIDVQIMEFEQNFPKKLYAGGTDSFSVQLKNRGNSSAAVELVSEGDIEGMADSGIITVPANSTQEATIQVSVPADVSVKDGKKGDSKNAVLRVKYTTSKGQTGFVLLPNPAINIKLDEAKFSAKAGEKDSDDISAKNSNDFSIDGLVLSIEITSAVNNSPSEVKKWFQFTEVANGQNPQEIEISSIPAKATVTKELQVIVPTTAIKEPGIKGNVVLSAPYLSEPIKKTLTLDVTAGAEFGISTTLAPKSPVEIEWSETLGKYEEKMLDLKIKNNGKLDLENIIITVENSLVCDIDWLTLIENTIDSLPAGETRALKLSATAPIAIRGREMPKYCSLHYRFDDPTKAGAYAEETLTNYIEISPAP